MPYYKFIWTNKNIQHIADNDVTPDEAEDVVLYPERTKLGKGDTINAYGYTATGRFLKVVYIEFDELTVKVVTAFPRAPHKD